MSEADLAVVDAFAPPSVAQRVRLLVECSERYRAALEHIAAQQPKTLAMIEASGFVFRSIGNEPGNWQHLAFSIYTDLCEVDVWARIALGETLGERRDG